MSDNIERIMQEILYPKWAERVKMSISKNFFESGRPNKWKVTSNRKPLRRDHFLQNSIAVIPTATGLIAGSSMVYAAIHNFGMKETVTVKSHSRRNKSGSTSTVKSHSRDINMPARPFMLIQPSDNKYFRKTLLQEFGKGLGK